MFASTQITNTDVFSFVAVLVLLTEKTIEIVKK